MQLLIDEEVKKVEQKAEEREVASIRSLKEKSLNAKSWGLADF